MRESAVCFHNFEWPPDGARLLGPVAWLRGWIVGRPGHDFTDVRVRHGGGTHLGVLGLPRTDLAAHFKSARAWLPAEFIIGVPVSDGPVTLTLEALDALGIWHALQTIGFTIAPDGLPPARIEGRLEVRPDGSWTVRDAHHPFHGHLDDPGLAPRLRDGRAPVFGWLLDETKPLAALLATTDTLVFNHLAHSLTDEVLAARVKHPGAGHARLRGPVDVPAALSSPVCLRLYAVSPDGAVNLCFAQRFQPVESAAPAAISPPPLSAPPEIPLPVLPSGRPRRLLFVLHSLWPDDATLRALDLARHLVASHRWAVRIVSVEDGPLRHDFEIAGAESLIVNPAPLFAARDVPAMQCALTELQRQIWWKHLDATVVFDRECGWAIPLAHLEKIPVLADCSDTLPMEPDPTAIPAVQELLRQGWRAANAVCFASHTAASAQSGRFGNIPAAIVEFWHTPGLGNALPGAATILAPCRTVDWLTRHHPATAARWTFRQGPARRVEDERLVLQDDALNAPALLRTADWSTQGVALCLGPLFGRGPLRPVIDAVAAGIPVVAPRCALTVEILAGTGVTLVDPADPVVLAHALLDWEALSVSNPCEATAIAPEFRASHDPALLLPRWERLLETVIGMARPG